MHEIYEDNESYISLFKISHNNKNKLTNKYDLEKALVNIFNKLVSKTVQEYTSVEALGSKFKKQYGQPVIQVMETLDIDPNFIGFLHSCHTFAVKKKDNQWQVTLRQDSETQISA